MMSSIKMFYPRPHSYRTQDYADKSWLKPEWADLSPPVTHPERRTTDRPAEHGPHANGPVQRIWWFTIACVLAGFWAAVVAKAMGWLS